jgi:hypothetical protein
MAKILLFFRNPEEPGVFAGALAVGTVTPGYSRSVLAIL